MNEKSIKNNIIVFGGSHHNTLGVIRSLGEKNISTFAILVGSVKKSFVLKSKFIKKGWIFPNHEKALMFIIENFSNDKYKTIVIPTSDSASSIIDLHYNSLINCFIVPNGQTEGKLTRLMDKEIMGKLAKEVGLTLAKTWVIIDHDIPSDIEYPCITKPISSIKGAKSNIMICQNKTELKSFIEQLDKEYKIQAQKWIEEKDFEYQLIGCSLKGGDEVIIPGFTYIIRSSSTTNTGFLKYISIDKLRYEHQKCIDFIKGCKYSGLFSLEFIRGNDGKDYFLEINFRNDGNAYAVTAAGINLPYIWVRHALGLEIETELNKKTDDIIVMPELVDFFQVVSGNISLKRWISDIRKTNTFLYYNKADQKPFYFQLVMIITSAFKKFPKRFFSNNKK